MYTVYFLLSDFYAGIIIFFEHLTVRLVVSYSVCNIVAHNREGRYQEGNSVVSLMK